MMRDLESEIASNTWHIDGRTVQCVREDLHRTGALQPAPGIEPDGGPQGNGRLSGPSAPPKPRTDNKERTASATSLPFSLPILSSALSKWERQLEGPRIMLRSTPGRVARRSTIRPALYPSWTTVHAGRWLLRAHQPLSHICAPRGPDGHTTVLWS